MFPQGPPGWGISLDVALFQNPEIQKEKKKPTPASLSAAGAAILSPELIPASAWLSSRKIFLVSP